MLLENLPIVAHGHVNIKDDLGTVYVDKCNAVHPQNLARVFGRALANEGNYFIHRIAFGNGGTQTDAAYTTTYRTPNDGQPPDDRTWDSRLYNETYSEIIDDSNANIGLSVAGGDVRADDPTTTEHVSGPGVRSNELGLTTEVVITAILNPAEPTGQVTTDNQYPSEYTEGSFTFDELGLFTSGASAIDTTGYQDVDVGTKRSTDDTALLAGTAYSFQVDVDGSGTPISIEFTTPVSGGSGTGGEILFGDLCEAINSGDPDWNPLWSGSSPLPNGSTISITDDTTLFPTITGSQTYGYLRITSSTLGGGSSISLSAGTVGQDLFSALVPGTLQSPVDGAGAGVQNDPVNPTNERERMLTHLIFSPVLKSANRTLTVTYTLTISVARTQL